MRSAVLSLRLHKQPTVTALGAEYKIALPPGCVGISYVFDGPGSLADWEGPDTKYVGMEWDEPDDARPAPKRRATKKKGGKRG